MALDLNERPWYVALLIGLVVGGVLFFILHSYFFKDLMKNIEKTETRIDEMEREIQKGRAAKVNIQKLEEDIKGYELELGRLKKILPTKRETDTLIKRLKQLTERGHFELKRFTPGPFVDKGFFYEWPIKVELAGTYHEMGLFFDRLSRFSRIINVSEMKIKPRGKKGSRKGDSGNFTIDAAFTQLTFIYKED